MVSPKTGYVTGLVLGGLFSIGALIVSSRLIWQHLVHYTDPRIQRKILRILWMVPVYAITSFLSLTYPDGALYFDTVRDAYEAYALYGFFALLIEYLGGPQTLRLKLSTKAPLPHPFPMNYCFEPINVASGNFLRYQQQGTLQFVLIKPLMAVLAIIFEIAGVYDEGEWSLRSGYLYILIINNISISVAMYCLVVFYMALKDDLAPAKPLPKFVCIKAVIFFSFWQGVVISFCVFFGVIPSYSDKWTSDAVAVYIQDFLICMEMFVAAFAHAYSFPATPFIAGQQDGFGEPLNGEWPDEEGALPGGSSPGNEKQALMRNVKDMLNAADIMDDTYKTFKPQRGSQDVPVEFTTTTVS